MSPSSYAQFLPAIISYGALIVMFGMALIDPAAHVNIVFRMGIMTYIFEFLGLHSAVMIAGARMSGRGPASFVIPVSLALIYGGFALVVCRHTGSAIPAFFFGASLCGKVFSAIPSSQRMMISVISVLFLILFTFTVILIPFDRLFPFPPGVMALKPANESGLFVDKPQLVLIWGILYFMSLTALEIGVGRKH